LIDFGGALHIQSFMRTLLVEDLHELVEAGLLLEEVGGGRLGESTSDNVRGEGSVAGAAQHYDAAILVVISSAIRNKHGLLRLHVAMDVKSDRDNSSFEQGFRDMTRTSRLRHTPVCFPQPLLSTR